MAKKLKHLRVFRIASPVTADKKFDIHGVWAIIPRFLQKSRWCWNWQTGMVEDHVPQGVRVQVPPSALMKGRHWATFLR